MPKVTLEYNLPEEKEEHLYALNGTNMYCALFDIRQKVFRPARKHGYSDPNLARLIEEHPRGAELVAELERLFNEVLEDNSLGELDI